MLRRNSRESNNITNEDAQLPGSRNNKSRKSVSSSQKSAPTIEPQLGHFNNVVKDLRSSNTPNRFRNPPKSTSDSNEFRGSYSTRNFKENVNPADMVYYKHMDELSGKINEIKRTKQ